MTYICTIPRSFMSIALKMLVFMFMIWGLPCFVHTCVHSIVFSPRWRNMQTQNMEREVLFRIVKSEDICVKVWYGERIAEIEFYPARTREQLERALVEKLYVVEEDKAIIKECAPYVEECMKDDGIIQVCVHKDHSVEYFTRENLRSWVDEDKGAPRAYEDFTFDYEQFEREVPVRSACVRGRGNLTPPLFITEALVFTSDKDRAVFKDCSSPQYTVRKLEYLEKSITVVGGAVLIVNTDDMMDMTDRVLEVIKRKSKWIKLVVCDTVNVTEGVARTLLSMCKHLGIPLIRRFGSTIRPKCFINMKPPPSDRDEFTGYIDMNRFTHVDSFGMYFSLDPRYPALTLALLQLDQAKVCMIILLHMVYDSYLRYLPGYKIKSENQNKELSRVTQQLHAQIGRVLTPIAMRTEYEGIAATMASAGVYPSPCMDQITKHKERIIDIFLRYNVIKYTSTVEFIEEELENFNM